MLPKRLRLPSGESPGEPRCRARSQCAQRSIGILAGMGKHPVKAHTRNGRPVAAHERSSRSKSPGQGRGSAATDAAASRQAAAAARAETADAPETTAGPETERQAAQRATVADLLTQQRNYIVNRRLHDDPSKADLLQPLVDELDTLRELASQPAQPDAKNISQVAIRALSRHEKLLYEAGDTSTWFEARENIRCITRAEAALPAPESIKPLLEDMGKAVEALRPIVRSHGEYDGRDDSTEHRSSAFVDNDGVLHRTHNVSFSARFYKTGSQIFVNPHAYDDDYDHPHLLGGDKLKAMIVKAAEKTGLDTSRLTAIISPQEKGWVGLGYSLQMVVDD